MAQTYPIKVPITAVDRFSNVLGKMGGATARWGARISRAGKNLTLGITLPTVALGVASARTGITFQRSLNRVAASTQASAEEMAAFRAQAEALAGQTHTLLGVAEAMELLALKGEDALSIQKETPSVLKLAAIANFGLEEAVELATDSLELYGLGAESAASMTDLLAAASQRTNLGSLLEALEVAGPRARVTGQDLRGLISLLDVLADEGFEGAKGGTAVNDALKAMTAPSRAAQKELSRLRIRRSDLQTASGELRELVDVLDLLAKRGAKPTQLLRVFGKAGGPAMAVLLENGLVGPVRAGALALEDVDGRAQELVDTLTSGGVDTATRFADAWDRVGVAVAESGLLDALVELVPLVADLAREFAGLDPETKKTIVTAAGVVAAVGPVLVTLGSLVTTVSALGGGLKLLGRTNLGGGFGGLLAKAAPIAALAVAVGSIASDVISLVDAVRGVDQEAAGPPKVDRPAVGDFFTAAGRATSGEPIGGGTFEKIAGAVARATAAEVGGKILVDFKNVPRGTKIRAEGEGDVGLDVTAGFNMGGAL